MPPACHFSTGVSILDYGTTGVVMPLEVIVNTLTLIPHILRYRLCQQYPCTQFWEAWQGTCPLQWDVNSWQAQIVVVNLGTNDFAFGNPSQSVRTNGIGAILF